jgi:hypothetical protein
MAGEVTAIGIIKNEGPSRQRLQRAKLFSLVALLSCRQSFITLTFQELFFDPAREERHSAFVPQHIPYYMYFHVDKSVLRQTHLISKPTQAKETAHFNPIHPLTSPNNKS